MKIIPYMFALSILVALPLSAEQNDALSRIKSLVADVAAKTRARGINRPDVLVDTLPEACSRPEFRALQDALKHDWPIAISNLVLPGFACEKPLIFVEDMMFWDRLRGPTKRNRLRVGSSVGTKCRFALPSPKFLTLSPLRLVHYT